MTLQNQEFSAQDLERIATIKAQERQHDEQFAAEFEADRAKLRTMEARDTDSCPLLEKLREALMECQASEYGQPAVIYLLRAMTAVNGARREKIIAYRDACSEFNKKWLP